MLDKVQAVKTAKCPTFFDLEPGIYDFPRIAYLLNLVCMGETRRDREATVFLVEILNERTEALRAIIGPSDEDGED